MLRIAKGDCFLEIDASVEDDSELISYGDARLTLRVHSHGYVGSSIAWAARKQLAQFSTALADLESSLQGEATLSSMSPGELDLKVFSTSRRGHIGLAGTIGCQINDANATFLHSVSFGFEFECSQLTELLHVPWIRGGAD